LKYLLVNRHAKSSWLNFNVSDHDRELNDKGFKDASDMGNRLSQKNISFDLMLTSSATRALTTCQLIALEIDYPIEKIEINSAIYGSEVEELKNIIKNTDDSVKSLAIFGHNPTFQALSEELYEKGIVKFSECSMLYILFEAQSWNQCFNADKKILFFDFPESKEQ